MRLGGVVGAAGDGEGGARAAEGAAEVAEGEELADAGGAARLPLGGGRGGVLGR